MESISRRSLLAVGAVLASVALGGCGGDAENRDDEPRSSVELDRQVEFEGLVLSVPSSWEEDQSVYDGNDGSGFGHVTFGHEAFEDITLLNSYSCIQVWFNRDDDVDEETVEDGKASFESTYGDAADDRDFEWELIDSRVIDGAPAETYEVTITYDDTDDPYEIVRWKSFIYKYDVHYEIEVWGEAVNILDVIDTVSIE